MSELRFTGPWCDLFGINPMEVASALMETGPQSIVGLSYDAAIWVAKRSLPDGRPIIVVLLKEDEHPDDDLVIAILPIPSDLLTEAEPLTLLRLICDSYGVDVSFKKEGDLLITDRLLFDLIVDNSGHPPFPEHSGKPLFCFVRRNFSETQSRVAIAFAIDADAIQNAI